MLAILAVMGCCALTATAQRGPGNSQFLRYPFDRWAAENAKPQIRWNVVIDPPRLSPHQRVMTTLHVNVDAAELQKRLNDGQILMFARIEDSASHRYQNGNQTSFARLHQGGIVGELNWSVSAFILPGDYVISLAVCDGKTLEHSFIRKSLHVAAMNQDPLPGASQALPVVEFLPVTGNPDAWYLPQIRARPALPLETRRPVHVELLVNTTPAAPGSLNTFRQNMELVVPSLKVLMGIDPAGGALGLSVIDLNRRELTYEQADLRASTSSMEWTRNNWAKLRPSFAESRNATVDVKTLAGQRRTLDYLAAEVARRVEHANPQDDMTHVVIVLSAPVFFADQEKPPAPDLPPDPTHRIFYICYSPLAILMPPAPSQPERAKLRVPLYNFSDDIEHVLKPMGARVFRVSKPEQFRRALAAILDEIAKL